jgi:hypothetical protein
MENIAYKYQWKVPTDNAYILNKELLDKAKEGQFSGTNTLQVATDKKGTYHIDAGIKLDIDAT